MLSPTNKYIKLNYGQLDGALKKLGYAAVRASGGHIVYRHPKHNSLLAVRHSPKTELVPRVVVASVIRNVINTNVAGEAEVKQAVTGI